MVAHLCRCPNALFVVALEAEAVEQVLNALSKS
jgi:hypothetical protein